MTDYPPGIANKQLELMAKYMAELGLSPVSRSRVQAKPPYRKKPWEFDGEWVDPRSKFDGLRGPWCREGPRRVLRVRRFEDALRASRLPVVSWGSRHP